MKLTTLVSVVAVCWWSSLAHSFAPSNDYTPAIVKCPTKPSLLRQADSLSENEKQWLTKRLEKVKTPLTNFLERVWSKYTNKDIISEIFNSGDPSQIPKIGIATSGGGYTAMFTGAGMISALDERTTGANDHGLGGILQSSLYLSGLSGGSWLVGSLALNNWTSVQSIIDNTSKKNSIWDITESIIAPGGINIGQTASYFFNLFRMANRKKLAGYPITITDIWGNALASNFMPNLPNGGAGTLWSDIRDYQPFADAEMPMPIALSAARNYDTLIFDPKSTAIETNPYEIGSWDTSLNAFYDLKYLGSKVSNGKPVNPSVCVAGFDQASFIMGTSSNIFNIQINTLAARIMATFLGLFNFALPAGGAAYFANPFKNSQYTDTDYYNKLAGTDSLIMGDGAHIGENVPVNPLIQKVRDLDVVFALDTWGWDSSYPDGTSVINTYNRQFTFQGRNTAFPQVPDKDTFNKLGYNKKPVFFGCYAEDMKDLDHIPPLIVYLPNSKYSYPAPNILKLAYSTSERLAVIKNGFEAATANNLTNYSGFDGCVGCAILRRKQEKLGLTLPDECNKCFEELCYRPSGGEGRTELPEYLPDPLEGYNDDEIESARSEAGVPTGSELASVISTISAALQVSDSIPTS